MRYCSPIACESSEEGEAWLEQAVKSRGLVNKLRDFGAAAYDVERWKRDILSDLDYLKQVHAATLEAREQPDPKFERVFVEIEALRTQGKKILVFTQSQRTAQYLESELRDRLKVPVGRIDSHVETARGHPLRLQPEL